MLPSHHPLAVMQQRQAADDDSYIEREKPWTGFHGLVMMIDCVLIGLMDLMELLYY
jgi:hypothetical protein